MSPRGAEIVGNFTTSPNPGIVRLGAYFDTDLSHLPGIIDTTIPHNKAEIQNNQAFRQHFARFLKATGAPFYSPDFLFNFTAGVCSSFFRAIFINTPTNHREREATENHETAHALHFEADQIGTQYVNDLEGRISAGGNFTETELTTQQAITDFGEGVAYFVDKDLVCIKSDGIDFKSRDQKRRKRILEEELADEVMVQYEAINETVHRLVEGGYTPGRAVLYLMQNPIRTGLVLPDQVLMERYLQAA